MNSRIIFVNSLFPCLSETFVFDQFEALKKEGLNMVVVSNNRPTLDQVHPRMRDIMGEVDYLSEEPPTAVLNAHLTCLFRHPIRYFRALASLPSSGESWRTTLAQFSGGALIASRFAQAGTLLHSNFTYGGTAVTLWAHRLSGLPYSITVHGSDLLFDNPPNLLEKINEAEAVVSISNYNIEFLQHHLAGAKPKRTAVIPLGVDKGPKPPPRPGFSGDRPLRILNVGRLSIHKAQHDLISACALLREQGVSVVCDIVGEGPKQAFLETHIKSLELEDVVNLVGPRFHDEVLELYHDYDVFVLSSITEGMPIVIMEAMRAGIPIVATSISAIPEQLEDGGLLVAPSSPNEIAAAVAKIVSGEVDLNELSDKAYRIVTAKFDLHQNHCRFKAFLETLAEEASPQ